MADTHDNHATLTLGGARLRLCASKDAETIYASRFADDVESLGRSECYRSRTATAEEREALGTATVRERIPYVGHLSRDIRTTLGGYPYQHYEEWPLQAVAMVWAMARADEGSDFDQSWDEFLAWYLSRPSNTLEAWRAWEELGGLAVRSFFRDESRQADAREPDEEGDQTR